MYKKYLLRCSTKNHFRDGWENQEFYFDTKEEMINYIKNGSKCTKSEEIRVEAAFELTKIEIKL